MKKSLTVRSKFLTPGLRAVCEHWNAKPNLKKKVDLDEFKMRRAYSFLVWRILRDHPVEVVCDAIDRFDRLLDNGAFSALHDLSMMTFFRPDPIQASLMHWAGFRTSPAYGWFEACLAVPKERRKPPAFAFGY